MKRAHVITTVLRLAAVAALAACTAGPQTPPPLPTVVLDSQTGAPRTNSGAAATATASGIVAPASEVRLTFGAVERVKTINVAVGDGVKAGQVLATLDDGQARLQVRQAEAAVAVAQANLDVLIAGSSPEALREAGAAVAAARAVYSRTVAGPRSAETDAASAGLSAANAALAKLKAGPSQSDIASVAAGLQSAEAGLRQAQSAYDRAYATNPAGIGADPASLALERANIDYSAAKALYDGAARPANEAEIATATQAVAAARAQLDRLGSPALVYDVQYARAQLDIAQARQDGLQAGARAEQVSAAKAQIELAQAALAMQQGTLSRYVLVAPANGAVIRCAIQVGETPAAGAVALVVADLDQLQVETTDLSERAVPAVAIGQPAAIRVKALNQTLTGRVTAISPVADTLGGDVVYKATIALDAHPAGLRIGMSADVEFGPAR